MAVSGSSKLCCAAVELNKRMNESWKLEDGKGRERKTRSPTPLVA
eukprot:CAMPEP_0171575988 /NCGR_PEP_ID=MMETSP0961-20121227/6331_1 /TAXON_ID=87120 /ORGANISM="Aurantiochytrium limacinum, Strain ATCCMYA-1381" /LENGTH=44 /DNA_ID= /DNA_START= /DNA_END= /DNA_ORIENTATION=